MTTDSPTLPTTPLDRLRWAVADAWTVTGRDLLHWARQPAPMVVNLLFPVLMVVMFGYLFGGAISVPGGGSYREFLLPGLFTLTMAFGIEATMVALACGVLVGWRWHGSLGAAALAVGLLLLLRFALLWVGIYLGLAAKSPEAVAAVQILVWPLAFLSNALVATATMPGWLGVVADWNPLSATAAATRELFGNPGWGGDTWVAEHALAMAVVWPLVLLAVFVPLSVRRYQRLSR